MTVSPDHHDAFSQISTRSAPAQIADQVIEAIRAGRFASGDMLPSERELSARFGVGRPAVREALSALELSGILRSDRGRGTVVVGSAAQAAMWNVVVMPHTIFETRLVIEPELARLAAEKRFPEDVAGIAAAVEAVETEFAQTGLYASDLGVHLAVAKAARNPILERALADVLNAMASEHWLGLRSRALQRSEERAGHVGESRRLLAAIEAGDGATAALVWREHLVKYRAEMLGGDCAEGPSGRV